MKEEMVLALHWPLSHQEKQVAKRRPIGDFECPLQNRTQTPYGKFFGKKTEGLYLDLDLLPIEGASVGWDAPIMDPTKWRWISKQKTLIFYSTKERKMKHTQDPDLFSVNSTKSGGIFFSFFSHFSVDSADTLFDNQNQSWSVIVICTLSLLLPFFTEAKQGRIQWNFSLVIDFYCYRTSIVKQFE